jgi:hypothetical protein
VTGAPERKPFGRDALAAQLREAWFYSDSYPHNQRWNAVADAAYAAMAATPTDEDTTDVDEEIRLIALCLDVLDGVDPKTSSRVLRYVTERVTAQLYQQAAPQPVQPF